MTSPVLFLGLGGTGKDTLMHVRRLFLDSYGGDDMPEDLRRRYGPARLPHMAYLCIDADPKMEDIDGKAFDEFTMMAKLTGSEFLNVELDPHKVLDLYTFPERYPEYARWFDFSLEKTGIPKHGCGQTRPWGRLAFFQHYTRIREQLRTILTGLRAADVGKDAARIGVNDLNTARVQVFVVFSVAGGTGSGLFLDTAFLLQDLAQELGIVVNAEALILLPEVFSNDPTHRVFANAYAALMEIEHYNLRRHGAADLDAGGAAAGAEGVFPVYWPGPAQKGETPTLRGPVFEPVWLISNRSRGIDGQGGGTTLRPDHKSELAAMMAEWMHLRVSPKLRRLGDDLNLRASNYNAERMINLERVPVIELGATEPIGEVELSCRYGSFGLAKVFTPLTVVRQIAGDRLASDIVGRWIEPSDTSPSDNEMRLEIRPKVLLRISTQSANERLHEDALYDYVDSEAKVGGVSVVREAINAFNDTFHPSIADDAGEDLGKVLRDRFHEFQWGATSVERQGPGHRGAYSERLRASAVAVFQRVRQGLDDIVGQALRTAGRRQHFAEEALRRLALEFTDLAARADARANDAGKEVEALAADQDSTLGHAANTRSRFVLRRIAKVAIEDQSDLVRLDLEGQIWRHVAQGARDIVSLIGEANREGASMQSALKRLEVDLRSLEQRLSARVTGLEGRHESILNQQVIAKNPDAYYRDQQGQPVGPEFVRSAEARLYGDPSLFQPNAEGGQPSAWALRERFRGSQQDSLVEALSQFGVREMSHVTDRAEDVATLLDYQFSGANAGAEYANGIRQCVQSGTAWLTTRALRREGAWESAVHYSVARPNEGANGMQALAAVFDNTFREAGAHFIDGPRDTIYLYQEVAAFPLTVLPRIRDYRDKAYVQYLQRARAPTSEAQGGGGGLHIELNVERYVDLVEPTREEASRRGQAIQLFIEALLKGRLTPARDRFGLVHYSLLRRVGLNNRADDLGRYDRAIRRLMDRSSEAVRELEKQVQEVETEWNKAEDKRFRAKGRVLAILDRYINEPANSPIQGEEWKRNAQRLYDRFVERWGAGAIEAALRERSNMAEWAVVAPGLPEHLTPPDLPPGAP